MQELLFEMQSLPQYTTSAHSLALNNSFESIVVHFMKMPIEYVISPYTHYIAVHLLCFLN